MTAVINELMSCYLIAYRTENSAARYKRFHAVMSLDKGAVLKT
jgi:hypothetical protein